jgi:hypothetical protein
MYTDHPNQSTWINPNQGVDEWGEMGIVVIVTILRTKYRALNGHLINGIQVHVVMMESVYS